MRIEDFSFGRMKIDGKDYNSDLIIYPNRVEDFWWREEGHLLQTADLHDIIREKPELLLVGCGCMGALKIAPGLVEELRGRGIELIVEKSPRAVEIFNSSQPGKKLIAAFHLTC